MQIKSFCPLLLTFAFLFLSCSKFLSFRFVFSSWPFVCGFYLFVCLFVFHIFGVFFSVNQRYTILFIDSLCSWLSHINFLSSKITTVLSIRNTYNYEAGFCLNKIRRCGMIAIEPAIHQRRNDLDGSFIFIFSWLVSLGFFSERSRLTILTICGFFSLLIH